MAKLCQDDYAVVRPHSYFPETFLWGECAACGDEDTLVGTVTAIEAKDAKRAYDAIMARQSARHTEVVRA